jgi:hypothetical protein
MRQKEVSRGQFIYLQTEEVGRYEEENVKRGRKRFKRNSREDSEKDQEKKESL